MTKIFRDSVFDFSRAKVRENGRVLDKYALAFCLRSNFGYYRYLYAYDIYSYAELKQLLISEIDNHGEVRC